MMANLLLFAAIAATSLHPGESKRLTTDLGSILEGKAKILKCDCNGACGEVMATSGSTYFYGAQDSPPYLTGSECSNCFCQEKGYSQRVRCRNFRLKNDSFFFLSVLAYTNSSGVKVTVIGQNVKSCNFYKLPSTVINLGSAKKGDKRYFNATCDGPCKHVKTYVRAYSGNPLLFGTIHFLPSVGVSSSCDDCFCKSTDSGLVNRCRLFSLGDSRSFGLAVEAFTDYENATLMVEAFEFKSITEMFVHSQLVGTAKKGERRNFNATCYGPCKEVSVYVKTSSGNPGLHGAIDSLPHLGVSKGCNDCFCKSTDSGLVNRCRYFSLANSGSFGLSVTAFTDIDGVTLTVAAANFKNITEIVIPSQLLNLGSTEEGERRNLNVTCNGPCKQVNVYVRSRTGNNDLHLAKSLPRLSTDSYCKNCFCSAIEYGLINLCQYYSLGDSRSFGLSLSTFRDSTDITVMVEAFNLKDIEEIVFPSQVFHLGFAPEGGRRNFYVTCDGSCKEVNVFVKASSGNPEVYLASKSLPHLLYFGDCNNCFCEAMDYHQDNYCQYYTPGDSSSFFISVSPYFDSPNTKLAVEVLNLKNITEIVFPSQLLNLGSAKKGDRSYFNVTCDGECMQVNAFVRTSSGHHSLYLAKKSIPNLKVSVGCYNCFCSYEKDRTISICQYHSNGGYSSFGLAVKAVTNYENATLFVEALNFKNITAVSLT